MEQENNNKISLKILAGIHQGACIPLNDKYYTIGKADSCDFILNDNGIESKHFILYYEKEKWFAKPTNGKVFIDGKLCSDDGYPLTHRSIVTIGSVHLSLLDSKDDWKPLELPLINENSAYDNVKKAIHKSKKKNQRLPKIIKLLLVGAALIMIYWISQGVIQVEQPDYNAKINEIRMMLTASDLTAISVSMGKDGYIEVVAFASDKNDKEKAIQNLDNFEVPIRSTIYVEKDIEQMTIAYFSKMQYPVRVKYEGDGKIKIKGFAWNHYEISNMIEGVKENIPGIFQVKQEIQSLSNIMKVVSNVLKKNKLEKKIKVKPIPDGLSITGDLAPKDKKTWLQGKNEIIQKITNNCKLSDTINYISEKTNAPGQIVVPITSVSLGKNPYVTLEGGKKCFEGGPLKAGAIIRRITPDKIIVQIQGREYYYTY